MGKLVSRGGDLCVACRHRRLGGVVGDISSDRCDCRRCCCCCCSRAWGEDREEENIAVLLLM